MHMYRLSQQEFNYCKIIIVYNKSGESFAKIVPKIFDRNYTLNESTVRCFIKPPLGTMPMVQIDTPESCSASISVW